MSWCLVMNKTVLVSLGLLAACSMFWIKSASAEEIPFGFHRMPDGTLMANDPATATAPPGYHLLPDGTLMADVNSLEMGRSNRNSNNSMFETPSNSPASNSLAGTAGGFEISYTAQTIRLSDLQVGSNTTPFSAQDASSNNGSQIGERFYIYPSSYTENRQLVTVNYALMNSVSFNAVFPFIEKELNYFSAQANTTQMKSAGPGDWQLQLNWTATSNITLSGGLSLPMGDHNIRQYATVGPMTRVQPLPYMMQLGSGTYDMLANLQYNSKLTGDFVLVADGRAIIRPLRNNAGYSQGNYFGGSAKAGWQLNRNALISAKVNADYYAGVYNDPNVDDMEDIVTDPLTSQSTKSSPLHQASYTGGFYLQGLLGLEGQSRKRDFNFSLEAGIPLMQNVRFIQLSQKFLASAGASYRF